MPLGPVTAEARRRKQERKREEQSQGTNPTAAWGEPFTWCSRAKMAWEGCPELGQDYQLFKTPVCIYPHSSVMGRWLLRGVWTWVKWKFEAETCIDGTESWHCLSSWATELHWRRTWGHITPSPQTVVGKRALWGLDTSIFPFLLIYWKITDNPNTFSLSEQFFQASYSNDKYRWLTMWFTIQSRSFL